MIIVSSKQANNNTRKIITIYCQIDARRVLAELVFCRARVSARMLRFDARYAQQRVVGLTLDLGHLRCRDGRPILEPVEGERLVMALTNSAQDVDA